VIYRVAQEALTNVARHAGVDRVSPSSWTHATCDAVSSTVGATVTWMCAALSPRDLGRDRPRRG
jgi:hypothetical protein